MIRRLLFAAIATFVALTSAHAKTEVLLAPDGTVFRLEKRDGSLVVYSRSGQTETTTPVPESAGVRWSDATYDNSADVLLVVWSRPSLDADEVVVRPFRNGEWLRSEYVVAREHHLVSRIEAKMTAKAATVDGSRWIDAASLHIVWWSGSARYAIVSLAAGLPDEASVHDLSEFAVPAPPLAGANPNYEWVTLLPSTDKRLVEIVFADVRSASLQHIRLTPVADHRIRIPIGVRGRAVMLPATGDQAFQMTGALAFGENRLVLYGDGDNALTFTVYDGTAWSAIRRVPVTNGDTTSLLSGVVELR